MKGQDVNKNLLTQQRTNNWSSKLKQRFKWNLLKIISNHGRQNASSLINAFEYSFSFQIKKKCSNYDKWGKWGNFTNEVRIRITVSEKDF